MVKRLVAAMVVVGLLATVGVGVSAANREAWIPGIASFALPGLGQVLNDDIDKAIVHFVVAVAIDAAWVYGPIFAPGFWAYIYAPLSLGWRIYSGYDAYTVAKEQGFSIGLTEDGLTFSYRF
jgi:hypothetical protein